MSTHLFVLLHGVGGSRYDLTFLASQISAAFADSYCHVITSNEGKTTDGVDFGGSRAASEVMALLQIRSFKTFSVVGHSLGGLYGRYMVGILHHLGVFRTIRPMVFISLAVPHLGARSMREQFKVGPAVDFVSRAIGRTTAQLMLLDRASSGRCGYHALIAPHGVENQPPRESPELAVANDSVCTCSLTTPFLVALAEGSFLRALSLFQSRLTYANLCGDVPVGFETAAIQFTNPISSLTSNYIADFSFDQSPPPELPRHLSPGPASTGSPFYFRFSSEISKRFLKSPSSSASGASVPRINPVVSGLSTDVSTSIISTTPATASLNTITSAETCLIMTKATDMTSAIPMLPTPVHLTPSPTAFTTVSSTENPQVSLLAGPTSNIRSSSSRSPRLGLSDATVHACICQIHSNLNTLHWHRVAIKGRPLLAHTDIVVKSETINAKGKEIVVDVILKISRELRQYEPEQSTYLHFPSENSQ